MGFFRVEKTQRVYRWVKTMFVLITMFISLIVVSAPILLILTDALLPSALLSLSSSSSSSPLVELSSHLTNYDFKSSLIDIPLISIFRSLIILCVYSLCDGPGLSRGPYLGIATVCSVASLVFVSFKASYVLTRNDNISAGAASAGGGGAEVALFVCSWAMAVAHVVVAYRTSCRERRKLLVYKIDIEALQVSACKNGFPRYQKLLLLHGEEKTQIKQQRQ